MITIVVVCIENANFEWFLTKKMALGLSGLKTIVVYWTLSFLRI